MIELYHTYWGTLSSWFSCICTINIEEPWVCDSVESVRYMLRNLEFVIQLYLYDTYWGTLSLWLSCICRIHIEEPRVRDWVVSVCTIQIKGTLSSRLNCICTIHIEEPWVQDWVVSVQYILRTEYYSWESALVVSRVVNRFWKWSLNNRFLCRFSIVFKNDRLVLETNDRF